MNPRKPMRFWRKMYRQHLKTIPVGAKTSFRDFVRFQYGYSGFYNEKIARIVHMVGVR